jgi:hypothetical protein
MLGYSQQTIGISEIAASKAKIKAFPDTHANVIAVAQKGDTVTVLNEFNTKYILVSIGTDTGYVEISELKNQQLADLAKHIVDDPEFKKLEERYDKKTALRIYHEKVWNGMTEDMLRLSLGNPQNIRRERTSSQVKEDWIYANGKDTRHIRLINGVVVAPPNS